ncbi:MAG: PrsW family intramembrane metalloprotease, partial [Propionibacteriaceae bacterium]|nr:PrsW family intramembrane metalloprotease [Propionibacteriaceae bacterium]
ENIIYSARVIVYGSYTYGTGDVMAQLDSTVQLRGIWTCFGHPLFTLMTGLGVGVAVTSRSKVVRVIAPATGYLGAAFLHMGFNWLASFMDEANLKRMLLLMAWPMVIMVALRVATGAVRQGRTVAHRLTDYVTMGWLPAEYPHAFSRFRTRAKTLLISPWHGNIGRTWRLQVRVTELALLREAITRGLVDTGAVVRERELVDEIAWLGDHGGLADGRGLKPYWPWKTSLRRLAERYRASRYNRSTQWVSAGSELTYSAADPRWKPPT